MSHSYTLMMPSISIRSAQSLLLYFSPGVCEMKKNPRKNLLFYKISPIMIFLTFTMSWASSEKRYLSSLQYASQKVLLKKQKTSSPLALSASMLAAHLGRPYQIDESWLVLSFIDESVMMRGVALSPGAASAPFRGGLFEYRVKEIRTGFQPEISLSIQQVSHPNFPTIDSRVKQLLIVLDEQLSQKKKFYAMSTHPHLISVPVEGVGDFLSPISFYPLDLPQIMTAQPSTQPQEPHFPQSLQRLIHPYSWQVNLGRAIEYEQEDFFGRPIDILWERGKPWPSYIKTPRGISILVESGGKK